jgi:GNAT superfamily N-acetyltransferase
MRNINYNLIPFDRDNEETRIFIQELSLSAYDDLYTAKKFPHDRANYGIFSEDHFDADLSSLIIVDGQKVGAIVMAHEAGCEAWELGLFHILPDFQKQGIGSAALGELEEKVKQSDWSGITMKFHSPRSLSNGVPAFGGGMLSFLTKRGYYVKENVAGAYINTPSQFQFDKNKIESIIARNTQEGFTEKDLTQDSADYASNLKKAFELCEREDMKGWQKFFSESYSIKERTGISIIEKDGEVVAVAAYCFEPESPTVWGYTPQWGPLLADSRFRGRGLASWVIYNSLQAQFSNGVSETILWTGVNSLPAKIYQSFGFRLLCPWFALEKKL